MAEVADPLKEKRIELVLEQLDELPTLPAVALRVLEATSSDAGGGGSAGQVVKLISSDPALTARILKLVHRADMGIRNEVTSVERAVVLLGFEAVRSAVLAVSVFQTFQREESPRSTNQAARAASGDGKGFTREAFWKHSIAVAAGTELLARQMQIAWGKDLKIDPSEAFVCGLLHDIGKVGLDAALPKSFAKVVEASEIVRGNIADVERQIVGLDHMVVGKRLAERWKLPMAMRDCIWLHGQLPSALPATVTKPMLVNLVTLADLIAREQHVGYSGNYAYPVPRKMLLDAVGLSEAHLRDVSFKLVNAIEDRARALGLGEASTGELYQQALAQANRELGKVSTQLAVRNKKLAVRARFFDALSEFHGALTPEAAPSVVLRSVAETAMEALGVRTAVAFSSPPGANYAEVLIAKEGDEIETMLADCNEKPLWSGTSGTIASVGADLGFVMSMVSPRIGGERRYWTALTAEGQVVGGVIWGAASASEDEGDRLSQMKAELAGLSSGWSLALRTAQIRDSARQLSEQLAEANRNLQDAQSEVTRAKTLMTIAEMAAGAAHEMNNPLAVISGRSQLLATQLTDEKLKKSAQLIAEQSERLSGMITELMEFAKPRSADIRTAEVGEIVAKAIKEAKARPGLADRTIEVAASEVPGVRVDPGQLANALAEILDNALQATEVPASTTSRPGDSFGSVSIQAAHDPFGGNVVLTVADDGCGMDEHTLRRAFDPFFSSKPAGRRRGMGLAKALRWVEGFGGSIRLDSRPGVGTRVMILVPADSDRNGDRSEGGGKGAASRRVAG